MPKLKTAQTFRLQSAGDIIRDTLAAQSLAATEVEADSDTPAKTAKWRGAVVVENLMTGDGRIIETNALRWENLPIPFRWASKDFGGHDGAEVIGRILTLERLDDGRIWGTGDFDLSSEVGVEAARQVEENLTRGVSVDLDDVSFEIRIAKELMEEQEAAMEDGVVLQDAPDDDKGDSVVVATISSGDEVMATTDARIRAATLVSIPAFSDAFIELYDDEGEAEEVTASSAPRETVVASASTQPPAAWFQDPQLEGPTALTVTSDGRVFGHLALWDTCHIAFSGQCVTPPTSETNYSYFRTGAVTVDDGTEVSVGHLTIDTLHASTDLKAAATVAHYEKTGSNVANVAAGEDQFGIWVAGSIVPGTSAEKIRSLKASPLSGDWRRVGTSLELVAVLGVNVPGFPVPRPQGLQAGGHTQTLIASGMLPPRQVIPTGAPGAFSDEDLHYLRSLAAREKDRTRDAVQAQANRIKARALAAKVHAAR